MRNPKLHIPTTKAFKKEVTRYRKIAEDSGIKHHELLIKMATRELWAALHLVREDDQSDVGKSFESDSVRVSVLGLTRNPADIWLRSTSIVVTAHTIDRVIQRSGIVDLPIRSSDISAIAVQLAEILGWAAASFFILGEIPLEQAAEMTIVLPG